MVANGQGQADISRKQGNIPGSQNGCQFYTKKIIYDNFSQHAVNMITTQNIINPNICFFDIGNNLVLFSEVSDDA